MVNTRAMHIFEGPVQGSNFHDSLFFFVFFIFKVTIIKTTSFWLYLKLNIKNPMHLFLIQPPSSFPIPFSWHSIPPYQSWTAPKWWTSTFESPAAKSEPRSSSQKDNKLVIPPSPIKEIATNGDRPIILNNVVSVKSQWSPSLSTPRVYGMLLLLLCKKHSFWLKKKVVFDYMVQEIRWVFFVFLIFLLYLMVYYVV